MTGNKSYLIGLAASAALVLAAYVLVQIHVQSHHAALTHEFLRWGLLVLAFIQALVQLRYFLHLSPRTRWQLTVLTAALGVIFIIVIGSVWIMDHLNDRMSPGQMQNYMSDQGSF